MTLNTVLNKIKIKWNKIIVEQLYLHWILN